MKTLVTLLLAVLTTQISAQTVVGKTAYDVQTNGGSKNRIKVYPDGSISTIWTGSDSYVSGTTWTDRGMFYNHYDGVSWDPIPADRVESVRTGFGELITVDDHEVVIAHDGTMRLFANDAIGGTSWTQLAGSGPGFITGFWPMAESPEGTNDIYVVCANANPPTALNFSRSDDGGATWAVLNLTVPFLTSTEGVPGLNTGITTAAETYQIKVNGSDVYVLFGMPNSDLILLHSDDHGNSGSWEYEVLIDFPINSYTGSVQSDTDGDGVTDTIATNDGYHDMIMEDDGTLHVFSGYARIFSDAGAFSYTYNINAWGFWHWSSGMDAAELIETELDWNNDECDNDPMAGIGANHATYRWSGNTTSPAAAWDPVTGRMYLLYTMYIEYTDILGLPDDFSAQSRRDIFGIYSDDDGDSWSQPANLTLSAEDGQENFFLFVNDRVADGQVHALWQRDELPGTIAAEFDIMDTSFIMYQAFNEEDFMVGLPAADFTSTSDALSFDFTNASTNNYPCYEWSFGDGATSDAANPSHTYASAGSYTVCLTVSNPYGSDTYCQEVSISTGCDATAAPSVEIFSSTFAEVSWDAVPGATQYVFVLRNNTTGERGNRNTTDTFMSLDGLTAGHSYTVRVRTNCYPEGMSTPSATTDFLMPLRTGSFEDGLSIYPNPSDGNFRIQANGFETSDVQVQVLNTMGQVVFNNNFQFADGVAVNDLNLSGMAAGTYMVRIINGSTFIVRTIVIE